MLWMDKLATTASKLASANGNFRMSPSCTSTCSGTPSAAAFAKMADARLSDKSTCDHRSTTTADVQQVFLAGQPEPVEQVVPDSQFAITAAPNHEQPFDREDHPKR